MIGLRKFLIGISKHLSGETSHSVIGEKLLVGKIKIYKHLLILTIVPDLCLITLNDI